MIAMRRVTVNKRTGAPLGVGFQKCEEPPLRALVASVSQDASIAEHVHKSDRLVAVNGQDVHNMADMDALISLLKSSGTLRLDFIPADVDRSQITLAREALAARMATDHVAEHGTTGPRALAETAERFAAEWNERQGLPDHLAISVHMAKSAIFAAQSVVDNTAANEIEAELGDPVHHLRDPYSPRFSFSNDF